MQVFDFICLFEKFIINFYSRVKRSSQFCQCIVHPWNVCLSFFNQCKSPLILDEQQLTLSMKMNHLTHLSVSYTYPEPMMS